MENPSLRGAVPFLDQGSLCSVTHVIGSLSPKGANLGHQPRPKMRGCGGAWVPFPAAGHVMVLNLNISVVLSVRFASEIEGRCSAPP